MSRLVFDIGGTNMRIALAEAGMVGPVQKTATPRDPKDAIEAMKTFLKEQDVHPEDVVGGIAGIIRDGVVVDSPHLREWDGFAMEFELRNVLGIPVHLFNDAELAGIGEAKSGAGKKYATVAYLTIGTGVGGTVVINGNATALEPGRQIIDANGRTLDTFIGGAALTAEFGKTPEHLPRELFKERAAALAAGIYTLIRDWSPEIVILNGSLMNEETAFELEDIKYELSKIAEGQPMPLLVHAALGDESALYGAVSVASTVSGR